MYLIRFPESISCDSQINISNGHFSDREKWATILHTNHFLPHPQLKMPVLFLRETLIFGLIFWLILKLLKVKHGNSATLLHMNFLPKVSLGFSDIWPTFLDTQCKTDCWKNKGNGGNFVCVFVIFYFNSFSFPFSIETVL